MIGLLDIVSKSFSFITQSRPSGFIFAALKSIPPGTESCPAGFLFAALKSIPSGSVCDRGGNDRDLL